MSHLRVVSGSPSAEELAVVTAVLAAAGSAASAPADEPTQRGRWNDPAWQLRQPLLSGPGGWRAAAR